MTGAVLNARLRLLTAATHAGECSDRHDDAGGQYWQAEADAARIELCRALGRPDLVDHWTRYYLERHGTDPGRAAA